MSLKEKVKRELGYMKKGAKILPKWAGQKAKGYVKGKIEEARERAAIEREAEAEARKVELQAYKEERIKRARELGVARAKKRAAGQSGVGSILTQLGEAGDRMSVSDMLGLPASKQLPEDLGTSSYIFSGMPKRERKKSGRR